MSIASRRGLTYDGGTSPHRYEVSGNHIVDSWQGIRLGGGRSTLITNNSWVRVHTPIMFDDRGMSWQAAFCTPPDGQFLHELAGYRVDHPPWAVAYPYLQHIVDDRPCEPVHNNISFNSYCKCDAWIGGGAPTNLSEWGSFAAGNVNATDC